MHNPSDDLVREKLVREKLREHGAAPHVVEQGAAGLLASWRGFVDAVAAGYGFGLDDYRNDLDLRGLIEMVGLGPAVEVEDARLRGMLVAGKRPVWSADLADAFWVRGYPKHAAGALLEDLRAEGIV